MRCLADAAAISSLGCYLDGRHLVLAFYHRLTVGIAQFQHLVHQTGDAIGIIHYLLIDVFARVVIDGHIGRGDDLCKAAQDIQRGAYLVRNLAYEVGLHLR